MSRNQDTARTARTQRLLKAYEGLPDEFSMLKGVLCMSCAAQVGTTEYQAIDDTFDGMMIAARMDAMNAAALASLKS